MLKYLLLALALSGCGKFLDKFSRQEGGFTEVRIDRGGELATTMNGGLMVYFAREGDNQGGRAFGFTSSELAQGKSVAVPNGNYKIWSFGSEEGSNLLLEGQAKCGIGNGGAVVPLTGGATSVSLVVSTANCAFGTNSAFGDVDTANIGNTNFDTVEFEACSTQAYSTCDTNAGANFRVRIRLLAGNKPPDSAPFVPSYADSLTSACSPASVSGVVTSSFLAFSGGDTLSPPMELLVYTDSTCTGPIVARFLLEDGLRHYRASSITNGSPFFLESPASTSVTSFSFKYP